MPFWDPQLVIVIATHLDDDHVAGLPELFERYGAPLLLTNGAEAGPRAHTASGLPLKALVLTAGHHGSSSSSNAFFLDRVRPQIVVISAGADNRFGHPHAEVLERAAAVGAAELRTDEPGTIEVVYTDTRFASPAALLIDYSSCQSEYKPGCV